MKTLFFILGLLLLVLSFSANAIPVSYKININYSGDISTGHVVKAVSESKATSKNVNMDFFVINHAANENDYVEFYFDGILFNNYSQPLPGSIIDLGFHNVEAPPAIGNAGGGNSGGGGGGGGSATAIPAVNPGLTGEETLESTEGLVVATKPADLNIEIAAVDFSAAEGEAKSFSITGSSGGDSGIHTITVDSVLENSATFTIASSPKKITLLVSENKSIDIDDDSIDDISITLNAIIGKSVDVSIKNLIKLAAKGDEESHGISRITGAVIGILGSKAAVYTYVTVAVLFLLVVAIVQLGGIHGIRGRLRREKKFPKIDYL